MLAHGLFLIALGILLAMSLPCKDARAEESRKVIHAGGLSGDVLYAIGGDQQSELISIQHLILSKSGIDFDYTEFNTMQEGFEALQKGQIDTLYPMTPFARDLEPYGLVASDGVYTVSWDIIFTGEYSKSKLDKVAVPGGRLAPFYCAEVFPESELVKCNSRLDCLDAVLAGEADSAVFNGFQTENIIQNGAKYGKLSYTVLPTDTHMVFALRKDDPELLKIINDSIAQTDEFEKTEYMVKSRAVAIEESTRIALTSRYMLYIIVAAVVLAIFGIVFVIIMKRIMIPLREFNQCMEKNERLPEKGSKMLRTMARTYNNLYDNNVETHELLTHEAEHDALTGLLNRRSFEQCLKRFESAHEPYLLMVVDLDKFKEVNDTFGHSVGDKVLQKTANALVDSFRSNDFVFRIGGDEFVVLATHPEHGLVDVLPNKVRKINELLSNTEDGLPQVLVSAGAALWEKGLLGDDVYKHADVMLYEMKEHDRGGFALYAN